MKRYTSLAVLLLCACSGAHSASPLPAAGAVTLAWHTQYLGFGTDACVAACVRGPAYNIDVPISQSGNASNFSVRSSDPSVAEGSIVMSGPGGQNDPAVATIPHKAGSAMFTVSGANGSSTQLAVTVTTISAMTVTVNGYPSADTLEFTVGAPANENCASFEGGYSFFWSAPAPGTSTVLHNFPAMGSGPLSGCLFTTVTVNVLDASFLSLATKTVTLPLALGQDNPSAVTIP